MRINADIQFLTGSMILGRLEQAEPNMKVADIRTVDVRTTFPDRPLAEAARAMCAGHIGALIVLDPHDELRAPVGILTDRDIMRGQLARAADLYCLTVGEVMTRQPVVLSGDMDLAEAVAALTERGVRRAPVVDSRGALTGIITLDDLLPALAAELQQLATLIGSQARGSAAR